MFHLFPMIPHLFYEVPKILMDFTWSLLNFNDFYRFLFVFLWVPIDFPSLSIDFKDSQRFSCILIGVLLDFIDFTAFYPFSINVPFISIDFPFILRSSNDFEGFYSIAIECQWFLPFLFVFLWVPIYLHWFSIDFNNFQRFWCILTGFLLDCIDFTPFYLFSVNVPFISIGFPLILGISNGFNVF